jgi:hypothetical protein
VTPQASPSQARKPERWAIYIDVEGFSALYARDDGILRALCDLAEGIWSIGTHCFPESPDRLFAHQTGDGFVVVSEFGATSLELPVSIAVALLRHVTGGGRFAKASIGEGAFGDILGCYPEVLRTAAGSEEGIRMGGGVMTLFPRMGTALINAVSVSKNSPSGSVLTLKAERGVSLPRNIIIRQCVHPDIVAVDWVHSESELIKDLQVLGKLRTPLSDQIATIFEDYVQNHKPPTSWVDGTRCTLNLGAEQTGT